MQRIQINKSLILIIPALILMFEKFSIFFLNKILHVFLNDFSIHLILYIFQIVVLLVLFVIYNKIFSCSNDIIPSKSTFKIKQIISTFSLYFVVNLSLLLFRFLISKIYISENVINLPIFYMFLTSAIISPVVEEYIFRKILISKLLNFGKLWAIILSSIFFASIHNAGQLLYAFLFGLLFGYIYLNFGFLFSLMLHIFHNFSVFIFYIIKKYVDAIIFQKVSLAIIFCYFMLAILGSIYLIKTRNMFKNEKN